MAILNSRSSEIPAEQDVSTIITRIFTCLIRPFTSCKTECYSVLKFILDINELSIVLFYITQHGRFEGNKCTTPRTKIVHKISPWRTSGLFLIKMCPYLCSDLKAITYKLKKKTKHTEFKSYSMVWGGGNIPVTLTLPRISFTSPWMRPKL